MQLAGTDHVTVMGGDAASTVAFYRDLLGMALVLEQPNLDAPDLTHLFFDTGDGYVDDEHMQAALEELGLDPTPQFEGEAPTGTGV
jgi:catechol 2,3-dioxygenase-like lactoylglutathione lyase family enzyme